MRRCFDYIREESKTGALSADAEIKITELEFDNRQLKQRVVELVSECENSENQKFSVMEDYDEMKREIELLRADVHEDKTTNKRLAEVFCCLSFLSEF